MSDALPIAIVHQLKNDCVQLTNALHRLQTQFEQPLQFSCRITRKNNQKQFELRKNDDECMKVCWN